jgi:hypothetical protein
MAHKLVWRQGGWISAIVGIESGTVHSLFRNLTAAGVRLYQGSRGSGDSLQYGHQAFAAVMNATLQESLCYATINVKEKRWSGDATAHLVALAQQWSGWQRLCNKQHEIEEVKRHS